MTEFPSPPVPGELALIALTGSRLYGTNRPDSDYDYRGIYIAPTTDTFRLRAPQDSVDRKDPDIVIFELRRFAQLAAAANPNMLEILWAETMTTESGRLLIDHRRLFLSKKAELTYGGYAKSQLEKFLKGTGGSRGQVHLRREKFVLHTYRLMETGIDLLRTGELHPAVTDRDRAWERAVSRMKNPDRMQQDFLYLDDALKRAAAVSSLPPEPDYDGIDELLVQIRSLH